MKKDIVLILSTGEFEDGDTYSAIRWEGIKSYSPKQLERTLQVMEQEVNKKLSCKE
jgi:hypothetical protein